MPPLRVHIVHITDRTPNLSSSIGVNTFGLKGTLKTTTNNTMVSTKLKCDFIPIVKTVITKLTLLLIFVSTEGRPRAIYITGDWLGGGTRKWPSTLRLLAAYSLSYQVHYWHLVHINVMDRTRRTVLRLPSIVVRQSFSLQVPDSPTPEDTPSDRSIRYSDQYGGHIPERRQSTTRSRQ